MIAIMGQGSTTIHAPYAAVPDRWHRSTAPGVAATRPTVPATSTPASYPLHPSKLPPPPQQATTSTSASYHLHPNKLPPASQQAVTSTSTSCHLHLSKLSPPPPQAVTSTSTSCHIHLNKLSLSPAPLTAWSAFVPMRLFPPSSPQARNAARGPCGLPRPTPPNQESGIRNQESIIISY